MYTYIFSKERKLRCSGHKANIYDSVCPFFTHTHTQIYNTHMWVKKKHTLLYTYPHLYTRTYTYLVQLLSRVWLFATLWTAACQASLCFAISWSLLKQVHWVDDAIQPSHPVSSPSPPAPNPSQHQSQLFAWGGQSTGASALASFLPKYVYVNKCKTYEIIF